MHWKIRIGAISNTRFAKNNKNLQWAKQSTSSPPSKWHRRYSPVSHCAFVSANVATDHFPLAFAQFDGTIRGTVNRRTATGIAAPTSWTINSLTSEARLRSKRYFPDLTNINKVIWKYNRCKSLNKYECTLQNAFKYLKTSNKMSSKMIGPTSDLSRSEINIRYGRKSCGLLPVTSASKLLIACKQSSLNCCRRTERTTAVERPFWLTETSKSLECISK